MPPHIPRPSLGGVQAVLTSSSSSSSLRSAAAVAATSIPASATWGVARRRLPAASRFVSTAPAAPIPVPPESPRYIRIPEPPQSSEQRLPPVRGHLPVPRQIFNKFDGPLKTSAEHIKATVPLSEAEKAGLPPRSNTEALQRLEAASRREALAAGLKGLWTRKQEKDRKASARIHWKLKQHKRAAMAPEGLDDVLTRGTPGPVSLLNTAVQLDPKRFERAEEARARHAAIQERKAEARRDALARLYVAAGDFIVDEAELEDRVNQIFTDSHFMVNSIDHGKNIWESEGSPVSVAELRADASAAGGRNSMSSVIGEATKTTARQKTVAEELTGDKL